MNVHDNLKSSSVEEIKDFYTKNSISAAVGMIHVSGDFNLGNVIRSANFFGFNEVFYVGGKRQFDRRSCVGTHNYVPVNFAKTEEEFIAAIDGKYSLVCIENNVPEYTFKTLSVLDGRAFENNPFAALPPLFLFGEEQVGIPKTILEQCDLILTIPSFGTVRSMNVGSCAAIVMAMYRKSIQDIA